MNIYRDIFSPFPVASAVESFAVICYRDNLYSTRLNLRENYAVPGIRVGGGTEPELLLVFYFRRYFLDNSKDDKDNPYTLYNTDSLGPKYALVLPRLYAD